MFFRRKPKVGTPENPEIIDPSLPPPQPNRFRMAGQILMWMVYITAPAFLFSLICFWLIDLGRQPGGFLAWLLLLFFAPPALFLTLLAVVADAFLAIALVFTLMGKSYTFPIQDPRMDRFIRFRRVDGSARSK